MIKGRFTILCESFNFSDEAIDNGTMRSMYTIGSYDTEEKAKLALMQIIKLDRFADRGAYGSGFQKDGSWMNSYDCGNLETHYTIIEKHNFTEQDWPKNPWPKVDD